MGFVQVSIYILNIIMILIGVYLFFLFIKSKNIHDYSNYNIIIMSLTILLDNIIRIIPTKSMPTFFHYLQAFLLVFFDKMILSILSMQIIVIYIIIMWVETYYNHQKLIFIIGTIVCIVISALLTTFYIAIPKDIYEAESYYYCDGDWGGKLIIDVVFNSILLAANFFCITVVLAFFSKKKQAADAGIIEDLGYKRQFIRFLIIFFINILFILETFLIIYDVLPGNIDFIYLCSCLVVDLCYSINSTVINETKKIFCRNNISNSTINPDVLIKKNTFGEDGPEDELSDDD